MPSSLGRAPLWARPTPLSRPRPPVLGGLPLPRRPEPSAHSCVQLGGAGGFCFLPSPAARGGRGRLAGFTSSGPAPARRHSRGEGVRPGSRIRGSQSRRKGQWARRRRGARRRGRAGAGAALKPGAPAPPCSPRSPASAPPLQGPPLVGGGGGTRAPALGGGGGAGPRFFPAGAERQPHLPPRRPALSRGRHGGGGDLRDAAPIPQAADPPWKLASAGQGDGGLWTLLGQQPRGGAGAPCASLGPAPPPALRVDPGAEGQATPLPTHGRSTGVSARRPSVCSHTAKHWPCGFPFWFKCHRFPCGKKDNAARLRKTLHSRSSRGQTRSRSRRPPPSEPRGPAAPLHPEGQARPAAPTRPTSLGRLSATAAGNARSVLHPHGTAPQPLYSTHITCTTLLYI